MNPWFYMVMEKVGVIEVSGGGVGGGDGDDVSVGG